MSSLNPEFYAPYNYTPDVARARHNLSSKRCYSMQTGALVPILFKRLYKGDDFKITPMTLLQSVLPLNRPLLDCFELRVETYLCPLTNYYGWMDNNSKELSEDIVQGSDKWKLQLFSGDEDSGEGLYDSSQAISELFSRSIEEYISRSNLSPNVIQKGSMFQYIGVPAGFLGSEDPNGGKLLFNTPFNTINIEPILCYLDIVRSYHVNTQYESIPFFTGYLGETSIASSEDLFSSPFTHQELDDLFIKLRYYSSHTSNELFLHNNSFMDYQLDSLWRYLTMCNKQNGGLFPVQHRPDYMRNLLSIVEGQLNAKVQTNPDGTTNVAEIQDKSHLQSFYYALYLSGGRYSNRLRTSFGMKMHQNLHIPLLLSVDRHLIDPSNITATAQGGDYDLGEMASKVDKFNQSSTVRVRPDVDSYLVVVASIVPLPGYSQGFDPEITHLSFMDDFTPELQGMSFESIPKGHYSALPDVRFDSEADDNELILPQLNTEVGKNVKWMHYRTDVNRCYGEFTPLYGEYDNMVLSRRYSTFSYVDSEQNIIDLSFDISPYVNPLEYNHVFAMNNLASEPFSLHVSFKINAKRPILKRIKPGF